MPKSAWWHRPWVLVLGACLLALVSGLLGLGIGAATGESSDADALARIEARAVRAERQAEDAEERAERAEKQARDTVADAEERTAARAAELDQREAALQQRSAQIDQREQAIAPREAAAESAPEPEAPAPAPEPLAAGVYYENCSAAREAGDTPLYRGDPGYRPALDRDSDGIACE